MSFSSEVDIPEVGVSLSNADVVEVGLSLSEVVVVEEGASLSLSDVEEAAIVEDWSFGVAEEDRSTETRMAELVVETVSVEVCDSVELKSLSLSSAFTGWISKSYSGLEVQKVAELDAEDGQTMLFCTEKRLNVSKQIGKKAAGSQKK